MMLNERSFKGAFFELRQGDADAGQSLIIN